MNEMRAMILTAGFGTRLKPLTLERAKPAIPLLGKPIVVRLVEKLLLAGVSEFRMNLHHLPHTIETIFVDPVYANKYRVSFSLEPNILGTAGGVKANEKFFRDDTFVMANGDIVLDFDLRGALQFHKSQEALATLILLPQQRPYQFYPVTIDNQGHITHFKEHPPPLFDNQQAYVFTGIHILEPEIFEYIPPGVFCEINDTVYPDIIRKGKRVLGFVARGYWNDVGNATRYLAAQRHFLSICQPPRNLRREVEVLIEDGALVGAGVWAEKGCVFRAGSRSEDCILWENVTIEKGVTLEGCIVGGGTIVQSPQSHCIITRKGSFPIE